MIMVIVIGSG